MEHPSNGSFAPGPSSFNDAMTDRLMARRTLVIHEPLTEALVARVTQQLALLSTRPGDSAKVLMGLWGDAAPLGYALHDAFQSARVQAVATGRVSGMGLLAFCGAYARFSQPGARFQLGEPTGTVRGASFAADVEELREGRRRVIATLAEATGQEEGRIERDMKARAAFDAEEAVEYGLVERIVQSADELG